MKSTLMLQSYPRQVAAAVTLAAAAGFTCSESTTENHINPAWKGTWTTSSFQVTTCEQGAPSTPVPQESEYSDPLLSKASPPSWWRRNLLAPIGVPLPLPRLLTPNDPALRLANKHIKQRERDEQKMRELLEKAPSFQGNPEKLKALGEELFEVTYGKGVTAQQREDFLLQYGCTGWTDAVLESILDVCGSRGIVEMGAGHGQWARAISEAYLKQLSSSGHTKPKNFDFVLAYDDFSNLPLNTHIYNAYTQPHHDYFGQVTKLETKADMIRILRSWACRGRALLLVYPPPGSMAIDIVKTYVNASDTGDNDTVILVVEGRGGANGDEALYDYFGNGDWVLLKELKVRSPPGDKGYEKMLILQRKA
eukprot:Nitzschia sp. Nitz4//scaffold33_size148984//18599//19693//NITZ4_002912-RA/size148984-processed-gene-0.123-mRNA-1//1//CDS//3329548379//5123//frame0